MNWLFGELARTPRLGRPVRTVLKGASGDVKGWYIYYARRGGLSRLLQIVARKNTMRDVLSHLLHAAHSQGSVGIIGRLEPMLLDNMHGFNCWLFLGGGWRLLHSSQPRLQHLVDTGNLFLSRLEGETCLL